MRKNNNSLEAAEAEMRKTSLVFKRSKVSQARAKSMVALTKSMSRDNLAVFILSLIINLGSQIHKKKLSKLLECSVHDAEVDELLEELEPILEDIEYPRLSIRELNTPIRDMRIKEKKDPFKEMLEEIKFKTF
jgi:hypothetical protein